MSSQKRPRGQVRVAYALFVLGGALLGFAVASLLIPDEPAVGQALGTATVGLLTLIIGQQTAQDDDEPESAD